VETVQRLQKYVRDRRAGYEQSLAVLRHARECKGGVVTKTSLMLGLGETTEEVLQVGRREEEEGGGVLIVVGGGKGRSW